MKTKDSDVESFEKEPKTLRLQLSFRLSVEYVDNLSRKHNNEMF